MYNAYTYKGRSTSTHNLNEKTDICTNISKHLLDGGAELSRAWGQTAAFF